MRQLVWGKTFIRAHKRAIQRHPDLQAEIERVLRLLADDPFDPRLRTHKLKGKLLGIWACSIGYDLRLVFEFVKSAGKEDDILLIEVGTHEEVY
ncbi:MAG: type II toxin-antitoxin system mRNA interferase toxin, RelE/StbE family [Nitrospirae bacterium]|nr:type II toxin-antitoxin system mRNA interferase toxin, RelE/StbE family [Nitrospirota bacterium]